MPMPRLGIALLALLDGATVRSQDPAPSPEPPYDPARAAARFRVLDWSDYALKNAAMPPVGPADLDLVRRGLAHAPPGHRGAAAAGLGSLCNQPFFAELTAAEKHALVDTVIELLASEETDDVRGAVDGLRTILRRPELTDAVQRRRALLLGMDLLQADDDFERWRAGIRLLDVLVAMTGPREHTLLGPHLLAERRTEAQILALDEADQHAARVGDLVARAILTRLVVEDAGLAARLAEAIHSDLREGMPSIPGWNAPYHTGTALSGLTRNFAQLEGELRAAVLQRVVDDLGDMELVYSVTSGRRTPFRHYACDALALAAPGLDDDEKTRAVRAVQSARTKAQNDGIAPMDIGGMYREVFTALGIAF